MSLGKDDGYSAQSQNRSAFTPVTIPEMFNDYFASVFNSTESEGHLSPPLLTSPTPQHVLSDIFLTTEEVLNTLLALDPNKATGPDGIPPRLLRETAQQISP